MANFLQRVIASGAATSVAGKPPVAVGPVVPIAGAPLPQVGLDASADALVRREGLEPQPTRRDDAPLPLHEPDIVDTPGRDSAAVEPARPPIAQERERTAGPDAGEAPATPALAGKPEAAPSLPAEALRPRAIPANVPGVPQFPRVTRGARIHAPREWTRSLKQLRSVDPGASTVRTEPNRPPTVEHPIAPASEDRADSPRESTEVAAADHAQPGAASPSQEVAPLKTTLVRPSTPMTKPAAPALRDPAPPGIPSAVPASLPTAVLPAVVARQPLRETFARSIDARPIDAISRPQSRITIGRVDVQVNNRPAATPPNPARATPPVASSGLLETFAWERFAMKP